MEHLVEMSAAVASSAVSSARALIRRVADQARYELMISRFLGLRSTLFITPQRVMWILVTQGDPKE